MTVDRLITHEPAPAMRERLRVMALAFPTYRTTFAGLNPLFGNDEFVAGWDLAALNATEVKDYDARLAARITTGDNEADALAACRPRCQALFYAIRQAWPATGPGGKATQAAMLKAFAQNHYDEARENPARMVALIEQAAVAYKATGFADALANVGWLAEPQQKALTDAGAALAAAGATHGHQSGVNAQDTAAYYLAQNQLYWFGQQLSEAAELLFADNPVVRDQFRLSPEGPERFTMTLRPGQRKVIHLDSLLAPTRELRFRTQAAQPDPAQPTARVWVDFLPAPDAPVEQRRYLAPTLKGQSQKILAGELGDAGPWLAVENLTEALAVVHGVVGE